MQKLSTGSLDVVAACYAVTTDVQGVEAEVEAAIAAHNEVSRKETADAKAAGSLDVIAKVSEKSGERLMRQKKRNNKAYQARSLDSTNIMSA